ncbi:MAG: GDP-L-fucose synthase [bacterium]|nr:GDP-L-fucose synthase [bacterium]
MHLSSKIYVAGHRGLVGSALARLIKRRGYHNLILKTRQELDLCDQRSVADFFYKEKPEYVFMAAAKVGGILANKKTPADFIYQNLCIQNNIIQSSALNGVKKLIFLGSSCIYPQKSPQPIKEEYLMTGPLEETNESYAIAKIAGIKMCQSYNRQYGTNFISAMPTNLYGPNDSFDLENSHVLPALLRKFHEAKINGEEKVLLWGTGQSKREFLHVDDLAEACLFLMEKYDDSEIINVGTGSDISIAELAKMIKEVVGFEGEIEWDKSKPNGTPRKLLDVSKINALGWKSKIGLADGIASTYAWYVNSLK